jgi:hypothetical protein
VANAPITNHHSPLFIFYGGQLFLSGDRHFFVPKEKLTIRKEQSKTTSQQAFFGPFAIIPILKLGYIFPFLISTFYCLYQYGKNMPCYGIFVKFTVHEKK